MLRNNLLVKYLKEENKSQIILLDEKEKNDTGIIIKVGDAVTEVKEGETVLFKKWETEDVIFEGEKFTIIKEDTILAVIEL